MSHPRTIAEATPQIERGDLQPMELVEACLERIEQVDGEIRAWVVVDAEGARAAAGRLGDEVRAGNHRGPLHGVPIGIKDIVDVEGMSTRAGSSLTDPAPAAADAPAVARLRQAGAIVLGKTVTTEFACFDPSPTRNPRNLQHTPGGSSSGSAAAVASGMCLAAIGSQTGGSITRPASYCGVAGLKPTFGRVDLTGVFPISEHLDHLGPIARSAQDLAIVFSAMTGQAMPERSAAPRLGYIETYFLEEADAEVRSATLAAFKTLEAAGAKVIARDLPESFAEVLTMHWRIMAVEAAEVHRERLAAHRDRFGPKILSLLDAGMATEDDAYQAALSHQRRFSHDMLAVFGDIDALVTPATPTTAPATLDTTGDPRFNSPWSYAGVPTLSVPCPVADDGMPTSLQLVGPPGADVRLLSVAAWCEAKLINLL